MKDTDKVTLTIGQIKKLISESYEEDLAEYDWSTSDKVMSAYKDARKFLDKIIDELKVFCANDKYGTKYFRNNILEAIDCLKLAKISYNQ